VDWITLISSAAAFVISTVCAALGYRRLHGALPREVHAHDAAIVSLRKQNATLMVRIRRLERAIPPVTGEPNGA
jgi:hypothetical protein